MRTLYFGGSFNPIHHGHLICARAVAETAGYEKVILVPNRQSPFKSADTSDDMAWHRLAMCRLAVDASPMFDVDPIELDRPGPSFTIDTARLLTTRHGAKVHWLIGADSALSLPSWREPIALLTEVHFVVMARPGWTLDEGQVPEPYQNLKTRLVTAPLIQISSTDIRNRCRDGLPIDFLTGPSVARYIESNKLYRY